MNILMIGNSYTYFHKMPRLLQALAEENGNPVELLHVTKGGRALYEYDKEEDETSRRLTETLGVQHRYTAVFLQEQSTLPLLDFDRFRHGVLSLTHRLRDQADRIILYQTWGRKEGNAKLSEYGWTQIGMTRDLAQAYARMAEEIHAEISPVGVCFGWMGAHHPEIELFDPDLSHPSYYGSCLAAVVHYTVLFGQFPEQTASLELEPALIQAFATAVADILEAKPRGVPRADAPPRTGT